MNILIICILIISAILAIISFKYIPFNPNNTKYSPQNEVHPNRKKLKENVKKLGSKEKSAP